MEFKFCIAVLLVVLAVAAEASKLHNAGFGYVRDSSSSLDDATVGDVIGIDNEMMVDSETNRRQLIGGNRFISYGALKRNGVPCPNRGGSYYNCGAPRQQANVYRRGCTYITKCARRNY